MVMSYKQNSTRFRWTEDNIINRILLLSQKIFVSFRAYGLYLIEKWYDFLCFHEHFSVRYILYPWQTNFKKKIPRFYNGFITKETKLTIKTASTISFKGGNWKKKFGNSTSNTISHSVSDMEYSSLTVGYWYGI